MHRHSMEAHITRGWIMTATLDTWHFLPFRPNRPTTVPAVSLVYPMLGTHGTVGTVDKEEELLLYI